MELIGCIAILGLMNSCLCDFFSDLEKLDIDSQLREIDEMLEKLDDDNDDGFDNVFKKTVDDLVSGDCIYKCKNGNYVVSICFHFIIFICQRVYSC